MIYLMLVQNVIQKTWIILTSLQEKVANFVNSLVVYGNFMFSFLFKRSKKLKKSEFELYHKDIYETITNYMELCDI